MRRPRWAYVLMLVVGAALGVAIAGVPSRGQDPPLRVQTEPTTTVAPITAEPPTTAPPPTTGTTARRPARR
ncbi:MAG: hypothetical protein M3450_00560 [Actinomycetota bacterium]|nr:hypothetical protein [Actinomycetota bacterium]